MKLGFNTTGNSQTSGRTTLAIRGLGSLRNTKGSLTRKYKYCHQVSPNYVFDCVFNKSPPPPPKPIDGYIQTIGCTDGTILTSNDLGINWFVNTTYKNSPSAEFVSVAMANKGITRTIVDKNNVNTVYIYNSTINNWESPNTISN